MSKEGKFEASTFLWNSWTQVSFSTSQLIESYTFFSVEALHTRAKTGSTLFRYHPSKACKNPESIYDGDDDLLAYETRPQDVLPGTEAKASSKFGS